MKWRLVKKIEPVTFRVMIYARRLKNEEEYDALQAKIVEAVRTVSDAFGVDTEISEEP